MKSFDTNSLGVDMGVCPNNHAYLMGQNRCPFCGESALDHFVHSGDDTLWYKEIRVGAGDPLSKSISLNGRNYTFYSLVVDLLRGNKYRYYIKMNMNPHDFASRIEVKPEDKIVLGRTPMTGKEFIKMCDVIIDNQLAMMETGFRDNCCASHDATDLPLESKTIGVEVPLCSNCGQAVKKSIPRPDWPIVGSIDGGAYDRKVPWNYKWNGRCENCGRDFSVSMVQSINSPYNDRQTVLRTSDRRIQEKGQGGFDLQDAFIGLSGVEIEQRNSTDGVQKMFISTNELKYLLNALKSSPVLEQLDWSEDYT